MCVVGGRTLCLGIAKRFAVEQSRGPACVSPLGACHRPRIPADPPCLPPDAPALQHTSGGENLAIGVGSCKAAVSLWLQEESLCPNGCDWDASTGHFTQVSPTLLPPPPPPRSLWRRLPPGPWLQRCPGSHRSLPPPCCPEGGVEGYHGSGLRLPGVLWLRGVPLLACGQRAGLVRRQRLLSLLPALAPLSTAAANQGRPRASPNTRWPQRTLLLQLLPSARPLAAAACHCPCTAGHPAAAHPAM